MTFRTLLPGAECRIDNNRAIGLEKKAAKGHSDQFGSGTPAQVALINLRRRLCWKAKVSPAHTKRALCEDKLWGYSLRGWQAGVEADKLCDPHWPGPGGWLVPTRAHSDATE